MPNLDERVALLEGRVQEQAAFMTDFRATGMELRQDFRGLRDEMQHLREETGVAIRDLRGEMRDLRGEMSALRGDMDRRFTWLVGIMVTGFVAVIGTVAGAFWGLLQTVR